MELVVNKRSFPGRIAIRGAWKTGCLCFGNTNKAYISLTELLLIHIQEDHNIQIGPLNLFSPGIRTKQNYFLYLGPYIFLKLLSISTRIPDSLISLTMCLFFIGLLPLLTYTH